MAVVIVCLANAKNCNRAESTIESVSGVQLAIPMVVYVFFLAIHLEIGSAIEHMAWHRRFHYFEGFFLGRNLFHLIEPVRYPCMEIKGNGAYRHFDCNDLHKDLYFTAYGNITPINVSSSSIARHILANKSP